MREGKGKHYIKNYGLATMPPHSNYPPSLVKAIRVKELIGRGGEIPDEDFSVTAFELASGVYYGAHAHPWPETYIFLSGTAECEWGDERFTAEAGTVTHCPPNTSHAMRVTSDEPLSAIIVGWAPGGRREAWESESVMLGAGDR